MSNDETVLEAVEGDITTEVVDAIVNAANGSLLGGGDLPAQWVIHTVGPNRHAGQTDPALLASCFEASLREAVRVSARSVAFPAVSAGVYGWDAAEVARIAVAAVRGSTHPGELDLVRFVLSSSKTLEAFAVAIEKSS